MDVSDIVVGKFVLGTIVTVFVVLAFWINTYPFIDKDSSFYPLIPDPKWFLLLCGVWGFCFVGGLMVFTLYHVYPHIQYTT